MFMAEEKGSRKPARGQRVLQRYGKAASVYFSGRRAARRALGPKALKNAGNTVIIDMDNTLLKTDTIYQIFKKVLGEKKTLELIDFYTKAMLSGRASPEEAMLHGYQKIIDAGATKKDVIEIVGSVIKEGLVREEILEAVRELKAEGKTVVLASKMSETFAREFVKRLKEEFGVKFDLGIGTRERIDPKTGKILKLEELVGNFTGYADLFDLDPISGKRLKKKRGPYRVVSKLDRIEDACRQAKIPFNRKQTTLLSDGAGGTRERMQARVGLLFIPAEEASHQAFARHKRLGDDFVREGRIRKSKLLSRPQSTARRKRPRTWPRA